MCIDLGDLAECLKTGIKKLGSEYLSPDYEVVLKHYEDFFMLVAARTSRLNKGALATCAKTQFGMTASEAMLFGKHMAAALASAKKRGETVVSRSLAPSERKTYKALEMARLSTTSASSKKEGTEPPPGKEEATEPPRKKVKAAPTDGPMLSPSRVVNMYGPGSPKAMKRGGSAGSTHVKYGKTFHKKEHRVGIKVVSTRTYMPSTLVAPRAESQQS